MKLLRWRPIAGSIVLLVTIAVFITYFASHPNLREQLRQTPPATLAIILLLYGFFVVSLAFINSATLKLCRVTLPNRESILLTMYSSIINFLGPLQSGPAFRAVYLKKKHGVNLKDYTTATFVYYICFALISGIFLLSTTLGWWLLLLPIGLLAFGFVLRNSEHPQLQRFKRIDVAGWYGLASATFLQLSIVACIYYVELHSVMPNVSLGQVIVYTGAANFALFVSLTPGAIGFRESFLVFSQRLHHIDSSTIAVANTIDRAMYIVLLLVLALFIFGTHASRQFQTQK